MFTNGCEWTPSLTENHKTLPILSFLDKKMDFMKDLSNLWDFQWILCIRRLTIFRTSQFGKNTGQNLTKLYMDINANFLKYLWNFRVNLCIMELRKIHQSFKLSKMADPGAAQDWARFLNFGPTLTWNISVVMENLVFILKYYIEPLLEKLVLNSGSNRIKTVFSVNFLLLSIFRTIWQLLACYLITYAELGKFWKLLAALWPISDEHMLWHHRISTWTL